MTHVVQLMINIILSHQASTFCVTWWAILHVHSMVEQYISSFISFKWSHRLSCFRIFGNI